MFWNAVQGDALRPGVDLCVFDFAVLSNPGDPNYGNAMQDLQTRMASRIQEQSQTQQAIYKVLTPEQQQQLPQILAAMKAKMSQHSTT